MLTSRPTTLERVTGPAVQSITTGNLEDQARVASGEENLAPFVSAAIAKIDGSGMLGRAMITQTWAQWHPRPYGELILMMGPFQSISEITYIDPDGIEQTANTADFEVLRHHDRRLLRPKNLKAWPSTDIRPDAFKIEYVAGYGDAATDVPDDILAAVVMLAAHFYEHREAFTETQMHEVPMAVESIMNQHRPGWYGG